MKKIITLFITLVLLTVLAACGNTSSEAPEQESNLEDSGTQEQEENAESDTSWTDIEERGTLIVGTSGTYSPVTYFNEANELTGFDVELVREIADYLELEVEFRTMDFDGILPSLRNGQIDMAVNDFAITEERLETFDFTDTYKYSYGSVIVRTEDLDNFDSAHDLEGVNAALGSLTSNYARFAEYIGANSTAYDGGVDSILRDIINGNQDAYLNDVLVLSRTLEEFNDDRLSVATDVKYHSTASAMPVLKGNVELVERLNEAIQSLTEDGTITQLSEEFLGADVSEPADQSEVVQFDF